MSTHLLFRTLIVSVLIGSALLVVDAVQGETPVTTPPPALLPESAVAGAVAEVFRSSLPALEVAALRERLRTEHARLIAARRRARSLARSLQHHSSTREAIQLACSIYGSCSTLWRRALCESGGSSLARNPSGASGLFQFLPSTWASTPFAGFSIWSPYANALAAGWMEAHGRGGEWDCR